MLRFSSNRVDYRIDGGYDIFELFSLVVHDHISPEAADVIEISKPNGKIRREVSWRINWTMLLAIRWY